MFFIAGCQTKYVYHQGVLVSPLSKIESNISNDLQFINDAVQFTLNEYNMTSTKHYRKYTSNTEEVSRLYILSVTKPFIIPNSRDGHSYLLKRNMRYRELPALGYVYLQSYKDNLKDEKDFYEKQGYDTFIRSTTNYNSPTSEGSLITNEYLKKTKVNQVHTVAHEICHEWNSYNMSNSFSTNLDESDCSARAYIITLKFFKERNNQKLLKDTQDELSEYYLATRTLIDLKDQLNELYDRPISSKDKIKLKNKILKQHQKNFNVKLNNAVLWEVLPYRIYFITYMDFYTAYKLERALEILKRLPPEENNAVSYLERITPI
jgi:hypothetical protein